MPNMNYFIGVVEDRKDPKNMGRVRVRIYGDHDADKTKIPTASLPWSQVMMPVTSAACGGVGESATGIVQGSWVVGFYMDGNSKQPKNPEQYLLRFHQRHHRQLMLLASLLETKEERL
jgi:hypothetical protein